MVHGSCKSGIESPGSIPESSSCSEKTDGQIHVVRPGGAGRFRPNVPSGYALKDKGI